MLTSTATARLETERPGRYLVQLCEHVNKIARMNPAMRARIEWSESAGEIAFGWGRCVLRAEAGALELLAEADNDSGLTRLTQTVGGRLEQIGRREHLTVNWSRTERTR